MVRVPVEVRLGFFEHVKSRAVEILAQHVAAEQAIQLLGTAGSTMLAHLEQNTLPPAPSLPEAVEDPLVMQDDVPKNDIETPKADEADPYGVENFSI